MQVCAMSFRSSSAGFLTNHLARIFARALDDELAPLDLKPAQFMTLVELSESPGLTQSDLAKRLDVEQATMAGTLQRMERDGLIERKAMEGDARRRRIVLTDAARGKLAAAKEGAQRVNARALDALGPDADRFIGDLRRLIAAMKT